VPIYLLDAAGGPGDYSVHAEFRVGDGEAPDPREAPSPRIRDSSAPRLSVRGRRCWLWSSGWRVNHRDPGYRPCWGASAVCRSGGLDTWALSCARERPWGREHGRLHRGDQGGRSLRAWARRPRLQARNLLLSRDGSPRRAYAV